MTLVERLRRDRENELIAVAQRYEHLRAIYEGMPLIRSSNQVTTWCRNRLGDGLPEWLVGSALANAQMNEIATRLGSRLSPEIVTRRGLALLLESPSREQLGLVQVWDLTEERLDFSLDLAALTVMQRHGAEARAGRGYVRGTFVRTAKAIGLAALDVPHEALFA